MSIYVFMHVSVYTYTYTCNLYGYEHISIDNFGIGSHVAQVSLKLLVWPRVTLNS